MIVQNVTAKLTRGGKTLRISGGLNKEGPGPLFPLKTKFKVVNSSVTVEQDGSVLFTVVAVKK